MNDETTDAITDMFSGKTDKATEEPKDKTGKVDRVLTEMFSAYAYKGDNEMKEDKITNDKPMNQLNWIKEKVHKAFEKYEVPKESWMTLENTIVDSILSGHFGDMRMTEATERIIMDMIKRLAEEEYEPEGIIGAYKIQTPEVIGLISPFSEGKETKTEGYPPGDIGGVTTRSMGYDRDGNPKICPTVNVKVRNCCDSDDVQKHFNCSEAAAEQVARFAFEMAQDIFWEDMPERAKEIFPDCECYADGKLGGWLVVEGLGDIEEWTDEEYSKWFDFEKEVEANVKQFTSCEWMFDLIEENDWIGAYDDGMGEAKKLRRAYPENSIVKEIDNFLEEIK